MQYGWQDIELGSLPVPDSTLRIVASVALPLVTFGLGWWVKGNEAFDAELAARLDDAVKELGGIEEVALELWGANLGAEDDKGAPTKDKLAKSMELEGRLHRLAVLIDFAGARVPSYEHYGTPALLAGLRSACTDDGDGGSSLPPAPLRIKTILVRSTELLLQLRQMRRDVLPRSWFKRWGRRLRLPVRNASATMRPRYWHDD